MQRPSVCSAVNYCASVFWVFFTTLIIIYLGTASLFRRTEQQARKHPQSIAISYIFAGFDPRREKRPGEIGRFNSASFIFSYLPAKKDHFSFHIHSLLPRQDLEV